MTREEFESILEEAYIEGYNTAISDIQEDILDKEAYDLEGEYESILEMKDSRDPETKRKETRNLINKFYGKKIINRNNKPSSMFVIKAKKLREMNDKIQKYYKEKNPEDKDLKEVL